MCSTVGGDPLAVLEAALEALTAEDLHGRSDGDLLDRSRRLAAARNRVDAALATTVRRAEHRQSADERHHTKVHHGFRVERQPDGRWRTWRPDGTEITLGAAAPLAAA